MVVYACGAKGDEVRRIQQALQDSGLYGGPVDGVFGGGTAAAVRAFQSSRPGLAVDGIVGEATWRLLVGDAPIPAPAILGRPLAFRCLALTGSIETNLPVPDCFCGISGDFDGQGLSFGALQWCLGQGSLQPLLMQFDRSHPDLVDRICGEHAGELRALMVSGRAEQLAWVRAMQDQHGALAEPWLGMLKSVGRCPEFQAIELESANGLYRAALDGCRQFAVRSERAVALLFDIKVQNGSIDPLVTAQIQRDVAALGRREDDPAAEVPVLRIIANRRAEAANPRWVEDVRKRKLMIAEGQGTVHGAVYDLDAQYGIGLRAAAELAG